MVLHDNLTGVLNQRAFNELSLPDLRKGLSSQKLLGVAVVDVDHFKKYNDCYGHLTGDNALRRVATSLKNSMRYPTDEVFRVGGDEFTIVMVLNTSEGLSQILDRLVSEIIILGIPHAQSSFGHITITVGGVIVTLDTDDRLEEAYRRADNALYLAKESGRYRWVISE